jgi:type III restriction enzyme
VPRLAVRRPDGLQLFDRTHFLDNPWKLEEADSTAILDFFSAPRPAVDEAHVDVDKVGQVTVAFVTDLHQQLALALQERGWTKPSLVNWLDRRLPSSSRRDVTRLSSTLFITNALDAIDARSGIGLEGLARVKFRLVEALVKIIAKYRDAREASAFQQALFHQSGLDLDTSSAVELVFDEELYAYHQSYRGGTNFKKHLFRVVGDLEGSGEEFECAVYIERCGEIRSWVRNTARQPNSFWLQTSSDKFYPDFVALLNDGRILVVEYKGSHLITALDAREKMLIGQLWADRSRGKCLFLMIENREFSRIDHAIRSAERPPFHAGAGLHLRAGPGI